MNRGDPDIRLALQGIQLFSDVLDSRQLDSLARHSIPVSFPAGSTLMAQGDLGTSMFCIVQGAVSVHVVDPLKRRNEFHRLLAGTVVGEMEILTGARRTATVTAATDVDALEIGKPALDALFAESPQLVESFRAFFAIRQEMLDQIAGRRHATLPAKLAAWTRSVFTRIARVLPGRS